jgi:hypothetical protein
MRSTLLLVLATAACGGGDATPSVSVEMAAPEALVPTDDTLDDLTITVHYDDGDGDLGGGIAEIQDCRAESLLISLDIPPIAPPDVVADKTAITGTLDLHVNDVGDFATEALPTACADLGVAELAAGQTVFCVTLTDAAGHRGDGDCTEAIALGTL